MKDLTTSNYAIALQRAIEAHCRGERIPATIASQCPWHAAMLDESLLDESKQHEQARCALVNDFGFPELPCGWVTYGPFGIWEHPDGCEIVDTNPGYVLTSADRKTSIEFADILDAMVFNRKQK